MRRFERLRCGSIPCGAVCKNSRLRNMRVWYSGNTSPCQGEAESSILSIRLQLQVRLVYDGGNSPGNLIHSLHEACL